MINFIKLIYRIITGSEDKLLKCDLLCNKKLFYLLTDSPAYRDEIQSFPFLDEILLDNNVYMLDRNNYKKVMATIKVLF